MRKLPIEDKRIIISAYATPGQIETITQASKLIGSSRAGFLTEATYKAALEILRERGKEFCESVRAEF